MNSIELWGGVECSVVRVGNDYARQQSEEGIDFRPVTAWALIGSPSGGSPGFDQTRRRKLPGLFDAHSRHPQPTATARLVNRLIRGGSLSAPKKRGVPFGERKGRIGN
ncbi:MAG: hypothetical protein H7Y12_09365 [Sphingobacteriaceae bacterium]|nr:hypothetical protein [Cytophagaceae bacterium]